MSFGQKNNLEKTKETNKKGLTASYSAINEFSMKPVNLLSRIGFFLKYRLVWVNIGILTPNSEMNKDYILLKINLNFRPRKSRRHNIT